MKSKKALSVERMVELECELYDIYSQNNINNLDNFTLTELDYLNRAYKMPYSIMGDYIDIYDTQKPKMDELKFITNLQEEFNIQNENDVIERIRNIRKIRKYLTGKKSELNIPTIKKYDKLVRDNIADIYKKNGIETVVNDSKDKEYWEYLLKKDNEELNKIKNTKSLEEIKKSLAEKLELIRAMSEYNGIDLNEITEGTEKKKQTNGGYQKRNILKRIIKK